MGLAQLTRSDSQALRELMERNAAEQVERLRDTIDERMSALTLALSGAVERNMASLTERVDAQLGTVAETVAQRARRGRRHRGRVHVRADRSSG